jgi:hypothetical protein
MAYRFEQGTPSDQAITVKSPFNRAGPKNPEDEHKPTLVLDLDETLVHSSFKPIPNPDYIIPVDIDGKVVDVYVLKVRSHAGLMHSSLTALAVRHLHDLFNRDRGWTISWPQWHSTMSLWFSRQVWPSTLTR